MKASFDLENSLGSLEFGDDDPDSNPSIPFFSLYENSMWLRFLLLKNLLQNPQRPNFCFESKENR